MFDILAIDWGSKRFGLAVGSSDTKLVLPHDTPAPAERIISIIRAIITSKNIKTIILGNPTNFSLQPTQVTERISQFEHMLKLEFPDLQIISINERNTTKQIKIQAQLNPDFALAKISKSDTNHLAAALILETYLTYRTNH